MWCPYFVPTWTQYQNWLKLTRGPNPNSQGGATMVYPDPVSMGSAKGLPNHESQWPYLAYIMRITPQLQPCYDRWAIIAMGISSLSIHVSITLMGAMIDLIHWTIYLWHIVYVWVEKGIHIYSPMCVIDEEMQAWDMDRDLECYYGFRWNVAGSILFRSIPNTWDKCNN